MATTVGVHTASKKPVRERGSKSPEVIFAPAHGTEAIATAGVCVALGVLLPYFIHPFGLSPRAILPMHFPVFLAGVLLSPVYAALVGIMAPAFSMGFTGMPTSSQVIRMMPELAVYGGITSAMLRILPVWPGLSKRLGRMAATVIAMLTAMIAGRLMYIIVSAAMVGLQDLRFYAMILIVPPIPGIIAQLIIIPPLAYKLQRIMNKD